jgi:hypothetical protein
VLVGSYQPTRLQAQAWARNDMQEYARCSKQKYEQISDKIAYERDLKKSSN